MGLDRCNEDGVPVGNGRYISPAEFLLMAGFLTYRASAASIDARMAARRILDAVLGAATAHGFAHADALESMMASAEKSTRVRRLAEGATAAVGDTVAYLQVIRGAGVTLEAGA
ncbi:hypothetical protein LMG28727_06633 [Paraburkholderia kirstenboschensis]|uniref:hypothetical protein n=1 Tax=Paraburkholderia kirstenboschensis TaxID=1245436 RepID=UPI000B01F3F8|nr:hypothetical protein [Paraburkholderia kirstenboschensis]CAD6558437.1 hypothetical protein LMG28727_06633 [Paraburkholderia kirstenboschensis]